MRLIVTILVDYDEATVKDKEAVQVGVGHTIGFACGDGMLTPTGKEVIDELEISARWADE